MLEKLLSNETSLFEVSMELPRVATIKNFKSIITTFLFDKKWACCEK